MRVVSLTCSNTEIVCALDCAHYLVGVDDHSDFPEGIDIEKVKALEPDIVLASLTVPGHEKIIEGLANAKLNFIAPEPVSLKDIYADIETIAKALKVEEKARIIINTMHKEIQAKDLQGKAEKNILIQWWPKPVISPGHYSWVNDLLKAAGGLNPLALKQVKSMPLEDQEVVDLNPDAIVISWCGVKPEKYRPEVVYRNEAFQSMDAIVKKRVFCVPEAYLGRPSPRVIDGFRCLNDIVKKIQT